MKKKQIQTEQLLTKLPPNNYDLECNILGAFMIDKNIKDAIKDVIEDYFYSDRNKIIFSAIKYLHDNYKDIDILTVTNHLITNNNIDKVDGPWGITKLTNAVISGAHIQTWISYLQTYYLQRKAIELGNEFQHFAYESDNISELYNSMTTKIIRVQEDVYKSNDKKLSDYLISNANERDRVRSVGHLGIDTGFVSLNKVISGWVNPDLIIVAARPGQGKTAFMINTIYHLIKKEIPVGVFSLEMSGEQLVNRLLSIESGVDHTRIRNAQLTSEEEKVICHAENKLSTYQLHIDDFPSLNIRELRSKASIMKKKYGIKLLCVDYLQLMNGIDKRGNRESEISEISRGCKIIAKELDIPVIALSQLSRAVESRTDKIPQLSDLRESGGIEQDADNVIFLMRPETYNINEIEINGENISSNGLAVIKIAKNRHGSMKTFPLKFISNKMMFEDYKTF
jgi:replicative DNA helicase